jgi:hypothetical protein
MRVQATHPAHIVVVEIDSTADGKKSWGFRDIKAEDVRETCRY